MPIEFDMVRPHVALVTINRPEARNALDPQGFADLAATWDRVESDPDIWVVVLTGAGDRAFCAGADLKASIGSASLDPAASQKALMKVWGPSKAIVAAINGYCIAGGLEIVLSTDIRVAVPEAEFGLQEVKWAIFPFGGGALKLHKQIPYCKAMEMLLMGNRITAEEALRWGLINQIVPRESLMDRALEVAGLLVSNGPLAIQAVKRTVHRTGGMPTSDEVSYETSQALPVFGSQDAMEGPMAFAQKRKPEYQGK